ncbi:hypothetical protein G8A07_02595 [Roseateles sp. DAIF2]|uniref:hypothetical protein n=1 Tax=Roseateles sp. DAIF2 TaxID=2714952 RepID=UPI0018A2532F|nr:hypothetical protein [Roseateles sp. DAIF2]QPF71924.1 hypothetical protein G8A07_02595 [Roseateles sp. DAIF2]
MSTAAGQAMYRRALAEAAAFNQALLAPLDEPQREQLDALLQRPQARAGELQAMADQLPPARRHAGGTRRAAAAAHHSPP